MGKLYIDETGKVAFDTTPDGSLARAAAITNGLSRMADLTERLLRKAAEVRILKNQNSDRELPGSPVSAALRVRLPCAAPSD